MSFMNPVDMVDEDAADLQFPKESSHTESSVNKTPTKCISARRTAYTKHVTACYNANQLTCLNGSQHTSISSTVGLDECINCRTTLQEPYVKCADCEQLLCLKCFAQGFEKQQHRNTHSYIIMRDDIQVFPTGGDWTARDERILLRALRYNGYGNWEAVSAALSWRHSPQECQRHYHDCYFGGIFERLLGLTHESQTYFPERMPYVTKMNAVDPPRFDDIHSMQFKIMAGYRVARGDFDTQYDMSAEGFLTAMLDHEGFSDEESEMENADDRATWQRAEEELKCALVRAYNHRLSERKRRYKVMRDHGLIVSSRTLGWISKCTEALGSEANCNRFLSFMQISQPMQFDMLVESLKHFRDMQKSIFRLYESRQNGVRTLSGASLYFRLKRKRHRDQQERARSESYQMLHDWRKLATSASSPQMQAFTLGPTVMNAPRRKPSPMDVVGLPGFSLLSEDERRLCSVERIIPESYLDHKRLLINENIKMGHLRLADARKLIKIDVNKTRQIYDFLVENGHINKPPP